MRLMRGLLFLTILMVSSFAFATFMPPNDLWKQDYIFKLDAGTMTQDQFNKVLDFVAAAMEPSVKLHGGHLSIDRKWDDPTVNASSNQSWGTWTVTMYGGLARRPEMTEDGLALVMCHEFGHHLGGFPFYGMMGRWAASEGQADYFATDVCAKKIWGSEKTENARFRFDVDPFVKSKCDDEYRDQDQQNLCYRTAKASEALARLLAVLDGASVAFNTPDSTVVSSTNTSYPSTQCRMDTYLQGSLCTAQFDLSVIPGRNPWGYQGGIAAEREAAKYSCTKSGGYAVGMRPVCWFRPNL
jgi:hypothetical protein